MTNKSILGLRQDELYECCEKPERNKECKMPLKSILAILEREK